MLDLRETSLVNQVFSVIEYDILTSKLPQGLKLNKDELAKELNVGLFTINQVLPMLVREMLIEEIDKSYYVVGISHKDIDEMYHIKRCIEVDAFKLACKNLKENELLELKNIIDKQEANFKLGKETEVTELDTIFHDIILRGCGSATYRSVLSPIHHRLAKYRNASLKNKNRAEKSIIEHKNIYEALLNRDESRVEVLIKEHNENAYKSIIEMDERE